MTHSKFVTYLPHTLSEEKMALRSKEFYEFMNKRRTLRHFSDKPVSKKIIENIIKTAGTAPSGAHKQPWMFCAISSSKLKSKIRRAAEREEYENYHGRMSSQWLQDLEVFETNWVKEFLEIAPWLIVVFRKNFEFDKGEKKKNYYVTESVGLATGFLLAAIHQAGLVALTHTPSPMSFLQKTLNRPVDEKPFLLIPVGYPSKEAKVPDLQRKPLHEMCKFHE